MTVRDEAFHHGSGDVRRDGESDSLAATGTAEDGGVDSNQPPLDVHERAARVARIDRGVRLNEILVRFNSHIAAVSRADDAFGHGLSDTERVANRERHIADLHLVAVGHGDDGEILSVYLDHGQIGLRIAANDLGRVFMAILHGHFHLFGAVHDMVVGQNVTVFRDDDARPKTVHDLRPNLASRKHPAELLPKEIPPERVVHTRGLLHHRVPEGAGRFNLNHTRHDFLDDGREAATRQTVAGHCGFVQRHIDAWRFRFGFGTMVDGEGRAGRNQRAGDRQG